MLHRMTESSRVDDQRLDGRRSPSAGLVVTVVPRAEVAHQPDAIHQRIIGWHRCWQLDDGIQALCSQGQTGCWPRLFADDLQRLTALPVQGATTKEFPHSLWTAGVGKRIGGEFGGIPIVPTGGWGDSFGRSHPVSRTGEVLVLIEWPGAPLARRPAGFGGSDVGPTGGRSTDAS